jgi:uncharacterized protein (DUF2147 family)
MKRIELGVASLALMALSALSALAADPTPTGEWAVEDGIAHIRVENCGGQLWGTVSWEKDSGVDDKNPDAAKRNRPTLGMPVLLAMKQTQPNRWEGQIYNSDNGKTYSGNISLASPDMLRVEGCLLGFLCGGQNWPRVKPEPRPAGARPAGRPPTVQEFCANVTRRMSSAAFPSAPAETARPRPLS